MRGPTTSLRVNFVKSIVGSANPIDWIILSHHEYDKRNLHRELSTSYKIKLEVPGSGAIYALHGEVLSEKLAKHEAAEESYKSAILLEPTKSEYYTGLGLAYYDKEYGESLKSFRRPLVLIRMMPQLVTTRPVSYPSWGDQKKHWAL